MRRHKWYTRLTAPIVSWVIGRGQAPAPSTPPLIAASQITNQWKLNEASGDFVDSVGGFNLTLNGAAGTAAGKIGNCRTFVKTGYGSRLASDTVACVNTDFSFGCWFYLDNSDTSGNQQIFLCRNAGSQDGNLHWIIRAEAAQLKLYIGNGAANAFDSTIVVGGSITPNTWMHFAMSFKNSTKEVRYRVNGGAVTAYNSSFSPRTTGLNIAIGGEVAELWNGKIDCVKLGAGKLWTDAEMLADYNNGAGWEL